MDLHDWNDVNEALRRLGELAIARQELEGQMTVEINAIKERFAQELELLAREAADTEEAVRAFVEEHKADFGDRRSKALAFGTVAIRKVSSIIINNADAVVKAIESLGWTHCLKLKKSLNKRVLDALSDEELARIGAARRVMDRVSIKPDLQRIRSGA